MTTAWWAGLLVLAATGSAAAEEAVLTWTPAPGGEKQVIERRVDKGKFQQMAIVPGTQAQWTDRAVQPGAMNCYRVGAITKQGTQYSSLVCRAPKRGVPMMQGTMTGAGGPGPRHER